MLNHWAILSGYGYQMHIHTHYLILKNFTNYIGNKLILTSNAHIISINKGAESVYKNGVGLIIVQSSSTKYKSMNFKIWNSNKYIN